jgi:hypothetical protein
VTDETPALEQRIAELEALLANPSRWLILPQWQPLTPEQEAEIRDDAEAVLKAGPHKHRVILQPPPLTKDEIRQLLRECVTAVAPGETLVVRVPMDTDPRLIHELYDAVRNLGLPFEVLIVPGDELGVVQPPGPGFLKDCRIDVFRNETDEAVRITHLPTGVTVSAPTREEAVAELGRQLIASGDISINDARAAMGLPVWDGEWAGAAQPGRRWVKEAKRTRAIVT